MKKSDGYKERSDVQCPTKGCNTLLKKGMLEKKEKRPICFGCFQAKHSGEMATARDVRMGRAVGRKKGRYTPA